MSKFEKKLNKSTKNFLKEIEKKTFTAEEELVFKTITLLSVNSLLYFIEGMQGPDTDYTGIKSKQWYIQLKNAREDDLKKAVIEIVKEFFQDGIEEGADEKRELYTTWKNKFSSLGGKDSEDHLVDRVFPLIYLGDYTRNEFVFIVFREIISSLFIRADEAIEKNLATLRTMRAN